MWWLVTVLVMKKDGQQELGGLDVRGEACPLPGKTGRSSPRFPCLQPTEESGAAS